MYLKHTHLLGNEHNTFITPNKINSNSLTLLSTKPAFSFPHLSPRYLLQLAYSDQDPSEDDTLLVFHMLMKPGRLSCWFAWFCPVMSLDEFLHPAVSCRQVIELEARAVTGFVFWARVLDRWCWVPPVLRELAQVVCCPVSRWCDWLVGAGVVSLIPPS